MNKDFLQDLNFNFSRYKILAEIEKYRALFSNFEGNQVKEEEGLAHWKVLRCNRLPRTSVLNSEAMRFYHYFSLNELPSPRVYWLAPNETLHWHTDNDTLSAVNFLASENNAPIDFRVKNKVLSMPYRASVLNVAAPHRVINGPEARITYKLSFFKTTYQDLVDKVCRAK